MEAGFNPPSGLDYQKQFEMVPVYQERTENIEQYPEDWGCMAAATSHEQGMCLCEKCVVDGDDNSSTSSQSEGADGFVVSFVRPIFIRVDAPVSSTDRVLTWLKEQEGQFFEHPYAQPQYNHTDRFLHPQTDVRMGNVDRPTVIVANPNCKK